MPDWKSELARRIAGIKEADWRSYAIYIPSPESRRIWSYVIEIKVDDFPATINGIMRYIGYVNSCEFCGAQPEMLCLSEIHDTGTKQKATFCLRKELPWNEFFSPTGDHRRLMDRIGQFPFPLAGFDFIPTLATPRELQIRDELRIGERVIVDVPGNPTIFRVNNPQSDYHGWYDIWLASLHQGELLPNLPTALDHLFVATSTIPED
jgi:hypothetical protein